MFPNSNVIGQRQIDGKIKVDADHIQMLVFDGPANGIVCYDYLQSEIDEDSQSFQQGKNVARQYLLQQACSLHQTLCGLEVSVI